MSGAQETRATRRGVSPAARRGIQIGAAVVVVLGVVLGTKVVSVDDPILIGTEEFDAATFGVDNFPTIQAGVEERAVEASVLAEAIAADQDAAEAEYAVQSSGGPVFSVTFTGVVGDGASGIYEVDVEGVPDNVLIRVQTGPAINGTELRDATGDIQFGAFTNQIEFQDAASALNNELKVEVLEGIDRDALPGSTVTVTGAFTLINPEAWLVTPVSMAVN